MQFVNLISYILCLTIQSCYSLNFYRGQPLQAPKSPYQSLRSDSFQSRLVPFDTLKFLFPPTREKSFKFRVKQNEDDIDDIMNEIDELQREVDELAIETGMFRFLN